MPWLSKAMKDVTSCDKPWSGANTRYQPRISEWGNPPYLYGIPQGGRQTRGTETSKYPEEEKTTVIAQVVASERAGAQTGGVSAPTGVVGPSANGQKEVSRSAWKGAPQRVKAP